MCDTVETLDCGQIGHKKRKLLSILGGLGAFFMAASIAYLVLYILALKYGDIRHLKLAIPETTIRTTALVIAAFCGGMVADLAIPGAFKRVNAGVIVLGIALAPLAITGFALNYLYVIDHFGYTGSNWERELGRISALLPDRGVFLSLAAASVPAALKDVMQKLRDRRKKVAEK